MRCILRSTAGATLLSVLLLALAFQGCGGRTTSSPVLARVGDSQLTLDDARQHIDTSRSDGADQLRRYVAAWINAELVFQEARRKGIEKSEKVLQRSNEALRQLTINEFLEQVLFHENGTMSEDSLRRYFIAHASEFVVPEDMIQANIAFFGTREKASAFSASIAQGAPWTSVLRTMFPDTQNASALLGSSAGKYYTVHTIVPAELWRVCQGLGPGEVSYPVRSGESFVIVQVLKSVKEGTPASFEIAHDEVLQRASVERRQHLYDSLLATLRSRYVVQVTSSSVLSDTVSQHE